MAEEMTALQNEGDELITTQTELMQKNVGRELVEKAASGDEAAFEELYMLTYRYVFAVARHYLSNDEDIRDAIQDTFTRVYKNLSKLNDPDAFAWWLRKIAENCSKTVRERKAVDSDLELFEAEFVSGEEELGRKDVELDITEVLLALDPEDAELLTRIYYDKLTIAEIARTKKLPDSTVRSRVKAAEKRLRELLRVRGIEKPFYGGEFVAVITTAFRNAIGTNLLSATVAQEILMNVREGDKKKGALIAGVAIADRNRAVLRLASVMVAVAVFFALLIFGIYLIINRLEKKGENKSGRESTPLYTETSSEDRPSGESPSYNEPSGESSSITSGGSSNTSSDLQTTSKPSAPAVFQPDCDPSEYNVMGNMPHNTTYHDGKVARQGDWFYYVGDTGIFKVKNDGSGKQKLTSANKYAEGLNVVGDWIYYIDNWYLDGTGNIVRMRTDGKMKEVLVYENVSSLQIIGNTGYYTVKNKDSLTDTITYDYKKIDLESRKIEKLPLNFYLFACITEDYFIYSVKEPDSQIIVLDKATKQEIIRIDKLFSYRVLVYDNIMVVTYVEHNYVYYYVYDLENPTAGYRKFGGTSTVRDPVNFYSPYNGGMLGTGDYIYRLSDGTATERNFYWAHKSRRWKTTFDDGCVYLVNEDSLYRAYPDGTGFEQIV